MATTIKLKNSVTTTNTPTSLAQGEVAINITDKKVWVGNAATTPIQLLGDGGSASFTSLSLSGNLTFTGTGNRITGDFSNATVANRVIFQTSTTNGNTSVGLIPNGTGTNSGINVFNNSDPTNAAFGGVNVIGSTDVRLQSTITGTGTYLPLTMYTGGSERLRIDTSGNVGIGTTSPASRLTVKSASSGDGIFIDRSGSSAVTKIQFRNEAAAVSTAILNVGTSDAMAFETGGANERMRIDSSGNVFIAGTTAPVFGYEKLGVYGAGGFKAANSQVLGLWNTANTGLLQLYTGGGTDAGGFTANGSSLTLRGGSNLNLTATGASVMTFSTNSAERIRIDSSGNVGIGTSSPTGGGGGTTLNVFGTSAASLRVNNATDPLDIFVTGGAGYLQTGSAIPLVFRTNSTERMRITSGGDVGIGNSAPVSKLSVTAANGEGIVLTRPSNAASAHLKISTTESGGDAYSVSYTTDGNNQIFTTVTAGGTGGNIIFRTNSSGSASERLRILANGTIAAASTIGIGGATPSTSGFGITFPATQNPSSDANTLDDYEEGTFTPTVFGSSTAGTISYSSQNGRYTKIGRLVYFELYVNFSNGTGTGDLKVGSLPFTSSNSTTFPAVTIGYINNIVLSANSVAIAYIANNSTTINLETYPLGGGVVAAIAYDGAGEFVLSGCYTV